MISLLFSRNYFAYSSLLQVLLKSVSADGTPSKLTELTMKVGIHAPLYTHTYGASDHLQDILNMYQSYFVVLFSPCTVYTYTTTTLILHMVMCLKAHLCSESGLCGVCVTSSIEFMPTSKLN